MSSLKASAAATEAVSAARAVTNRIQRDRDPAVRRARGQARRARAIRRVQRFLVMAALGIAALLIAMLAWSLIVNPLGILGFLLLPVLGFLVLMGAGVLSGERRVAPQAIGTAASLPQIAARADEYLHQQRRALPAPAQELTDMIGQRLASLGPQLAALNPQVPEAQELRRLVGDELPDLIDRYRRVPAQMRRTDRNGRVPEVELVEGLQLVDAKIDEVVHQIAAADMDRLSSHKRYLELRYAEPGSGSGEM